MVENCLRRDRVVHVAAHDDVALTVGIDANLARTRDPGKLALEIAERVSDGHRVDDLRVLFFGVVLKAVDDVVELAELGAVRGHAAYDYGVAKGKDLDARLGDRRA